VSHAWRTFNSVGKCIPSQLLYLADNFHSLLQGPVVQILLDEKRDGCFTLVCHDQPLLILTYFSSTIREEFPANHPLLQWSSHPQQVPTAVRLIGGSANAIKDLVEWMSACCHRNSIVPLRAVITCPARLTLAVDGIQRLGIDLLVEETSQLLSKLHHELFEVDTVIEIFAAGHNLPSEVANAICHCVARYFFHGSLPEIDKWMHLATMNLKFDDGVKAWLRPGALNEGPDVIGAGDLWTSRSALTYPARWYQTPSAGPSYERLRPSTPYPPVYPPHQHHRGDSYPPAGYTSTPGWHGTNAPPPPPPKPDAYRQTPSSAHDPQKYSHLPVHTVRCIHCHQVYSAADAHHRCNTGRAFTIDSTPSPPRRSYSHSQHERANYRYERPRSPSVSRSHSQRRFSHPEQDWDASYEPPQPGEYLRERRQLGPDHFVHFFTDQYGRERVVTKGGDVSVEGPRWY
jgi:hypothetical protein